MRILCVILALNLLILQSCSHNEPTLQNELSKRLRYKQLWFYAMPKLVNHFI